MEYFDTSNSASSVQFVRGVNETLVQYRDTRLAVINLVSGYARISRRANGFLRRQRLESQRQDGELFLLGFGGVSRLAGVRKVHIRGSFRLFTAGFSTQAAAAAASASMNRHACCCSQTTPRQTHASVYQAILSIRFVVNR